MLRISTSTSTISKPNRSRSGNRKKVSTSVIFVRFLEKAKNMENIKTDDSEIIKSVLDDFINGNRSDAKAAIKRLLNDGFWIKLKMYCDQYLWDEEYKTFFKILEWFYWEHK